MTTALRNEHLTRRSSSWVMPLGFMALVVVGCGPGHRPIPSEAQLVHLVATQSEVRLTPGTVRAGDIYVVLDEPVDGSFSFASLKRAAEATPGPMSDDDLERLAHGDTEGTAIEGFSVGCDAAQQAEARGKLGYCGNVWKLSLAAGKYAILGPGWTEQQTEASVDPTAHPGGFVSPAFMAVLDVLP